MNPVHGLIVSVPLFLLTTSQECNLCGNRSQVAALATLNLEDPLDPLFTQYNEGEGFLLSYIEWLPEDLLRLVQEQHPSYQYEYSYSASEKYLMSLCQCGGRYGDHYVHGHILNEAFREPDKLHVVKLSIDGSFVIPCSYRSSDALAQLLQT
jgi:hypothetical protein